MKAEQTLFRIAIAIFLFCSLSLGGLDQSGNFNAMNMTASEFSSLVPSSDVQSSFVDTDAPDTASTDGGMDMAVYTEEAPLATDIGRLVPSQVQSNPPKYMYYNGDYLAWNGFAATFPSNKPSLWIERAVSWSFYATLPLGSWTQQLIYVPQTSPVTMYEIYPSGYVMGYNLGVVQPGYYYIWYYADSPGRHSSIFSTNNGFSNAVIIDVYGTRSIVKPIKPDPKKECEANPLCHWVNGQCLCTGWDNPEKKKCEANPLCDWVDGQCLCRGLDDSEKKKCEQSANCAWVDNRCDCYMPGPEPEPEPEPFNPAPNPVAECEANGCFWANGRCNCMGLLGGNTDSGDNQELMGGLTAEA